MNINELYAKRCFLIKRYQKEKATIENLTPPPGCRWTSFRKENELLSAISELCAITRLLDTNKELIHLALKGD